MTTVREHYLIENENTRFVIEGLLNEVPELDDDMFGINYFNGLLTMAISLIMCGTPMTNDMLTTNEAFLILYPYFYEENLDWIEEAISEKFYKSAFEKARAYYKEN